MSALRSLRIRRGETDVGSLFALDDGRSYFVFDQAYALNPKRPLLSVSFQAQSEAGTATQLLDPGLASTIGGGGGRLPVFFRNLLPEGMLRKHLQQLANLTEDDELGLLAYCGEDLPGDVWATAETLGGQALARLAAQGQDSVDRPGAANGLQRAAGRCVRTAAPDQGQ